MTELAMAADIVLPGAAWVEKNAAYVNMQGRLQNSSRVLTPPGDAQEDWQVFVNVGLALGAPVTYATSTRGASPACRRPCARIRHMAVLRPLEFARPVSARHWLQSSNPSERWKWDFMFQDLPPVKFSDSTGSSVTPEHAATEGSKVALSRCSLP